MVQILTVSTETVASERQKGSFECNVCGKILTRHWDLLRHKQENQQCRRLQSRTTSRHTTPVDVPFDVPREDVTSPVSDAATTSLDRTPRVSPERQQSIPPLGELFGETVSFEEVIASGEVFPPDLLTPPIERATAPAAKTALEEETAREETAPEETAPEEETALEEETAPGEQIGLEEDTAVEEKEKIPEIELPCLDSFKWGSHNRSKVGSRKFLSFIRGRIPVSQSSTVNNRQDFKNRMMRSTPVVLRQARGKLPGLVVPSATNGTFRRITEGIPYNRHVNVCFSAVQEVEDSMTLDSFLDEHEHQFRQPYFHPMNIIDLDIGPHKKTMKQIFGSKLDRRIFFGSNLHLKIASLNP